MPSKGITSYGYVASSKQSNAQLQVLVPSANYSWLVACDQGVKQVFPNWSNAPFTVQSGNAQINLTDICHAKPDTPGNVTFQTLNLPDNFKYSTQIYPISGEIGASGAVDLLKTPANINAERAISWALYRAGAGNFGLTDQYQQYLYLTDNHSQWMGDLVNSNSAYGQQAFNRFVLPGAHDAGMFDPTWINNNLSALNSSISVILNMVMGPTFGGLVSDLVTSVDSYLPRFLVYFAFTQKEQVPTMLDLGVRYFDFRPGKVAAEVQKYLPQPDGILYHQHNFIPGYPYLSFLTDVLNWLKDHPTEIVTISLSTNGFLDHASMDPTEEELENVWNEAMKNTGADVVIGTRYDLASSYQTLIDQKKRIIFLNNSNAISDSATNSYYPASKYDTYDGNDDQYATFSSNTIIDNVLNKMSASDQSGKDYTVVQIQGTCTAALMTNLENAWNDNGAKCAAEVAQEVVTSTDSNAASPLLSTKALFDSATYPWVHQNLTSHLSNDQLVVVLNDFADNALADVCKAVTEERMKA